MEKSMQQVQSQNDKLVPIDTSGDPVEVELKEDEKKVNSDNTESEIKVEEEVEQDTAVETYEKKEELEDYSASVKRRKERRGTINST